VAVPAIDLQPGLLLLPDAWPRPHRGYPRGAHGLAGAECAEVEGSNGCDFFYAEISESTISHRECMQVILTKTCFSAPFFPVLPPP